MLGFARKRTGSIAHLRFGDEIETILHARPVSGLHFPHLRTVRASDRATEAAKGHPVRGGGPRLGRIRDCLHPARRSLKMPWRLRTAHALLRTCPHMLRQCSVAVVRAPRRLKVNRGVGTAVVRGTGYRRPRRSRFSRVKERTKAA